MVSIKDVARNAGVSVSTVSHVLNKTRYVSPETLQKVQKAVDELDYKPNSVARALKMQRTKTLGMLISNSSNPFFSEVIRGIDQGCYTNSYSLIMCNCDNNPDRQLFCLNSLRMRQIDAMIVLITHANKEFDRQLSEESHLPMVVLDAEEQNNFCVIRDNSVLGGELATRFLISRGFTKIGVLMGPNNHPRSRERFSGFVKAMSEANLDIEKCWCEAGKLSAEGGYKAMQTLLANNRQELPQALFAFNDLIALGAIRACNENGISVPDDLSLIGYDDIDLAAYFSPPLSTIYQPGYDLGKQAATMLIDNLENDKKLPSTLVLNPKLVVRESVGQVS